MTKHSYLKFCVLLLIIAGCEEYKYCIEMKPFSGGIERKLICSGNFSDEELERIVGLYENRINHYTFSGRFDANLPKDVGGAGFYTSFMSNMGKTTVYSERFQGDDDIYVKLNQINQGVDQLIDFVIGWLEYELGDEPNFDKLHEFCDNDLRRDCKNLLYYFWLAQILSNYQDDVQEEFFMRTIHYLFERDYISQKDVPLLFGGSKESVYNFIRRFVAGKMGYLDPNVMDERLKFLSNEEHLEKSIERYIPTTDLYKKIWEAKKIEESDPNAEPPEIGDVLSSILEEAGFEFDLFPPTYTIEVKLNCDSVPYTSNGKWDKEAQQIVWSVKTNSFYFYIVEIPSLPTYFYCSWSTPDKKFQEEHFGRVILSDEDLAQYCIWGESLDEGKSKEWDSFVLSLNPGEDLEGRLNAFRFSIDQQKVLDAEVSDLAKVPRELILAGLKAGKKNKDEIKTQAVEE
jgi:hypothetical protein